MASKNKAQAGPKQPGNPLITMGVTFPATCAVIWAINHYLIPTDFPFLAILGPLLFIGSAIAAVEQGSQRSAYAGMRRLVPGFTGERLPLFSLLGYDGPEGPLAFDTSEQVGSIGIGADTLFVILNKRDKRTHPHEYLGGKLAPGPTGRGFLAFRRDQIREVDVQVRTDAEIAGSAQDKREYADRLGDFVGQRVASAMGTTVSTKIIPYAAYITIRAESPAGDRWLAAAVPTEIPAETMRFLSVQTIDNLKLVDDAIDYGIGEGQAALTDAAGVTDVLDDIAEARAWLEPGAQIGSTDGRRGRLAARLIARRLRALAGLSPSRAAVPEPVTA